MSGGREADSRTTRQGEVEDLRQGMVGQWGPFLLGVEASLGPVLEKGQGPCPNCGGHDRCFPHTDFAETGGIGCRRCDPQGCGDGFGVYRWLTGQSFGDAKRAVSEYLGRGKSAESPKAPAKKTTSKKRPIESVRLVEMSDAERFCQAEAWAARNAPITAEALIETAKLGEVQIGRASHLCWLFFGGPKESDPTAVIAYRADGEMFPPCGKLLERKVHLVGGSKKAYVPFGGWSRIKTASRVFRVEGCKDALVLWPWLGSDDAVVSASFGSAYNRDPRRNPPVEFLRAKFVVAIGDADEPGQRAVVLFCDQVQDVAAEIHNKQLPYEVTGSEGRDIRDAARDGVLQSLADLMALPSVAVEQRAVCVVNADIFGSGKFAEVVALSMRQVVGSAREAVPTLATLGGKVFEHSGEEVNFIPDSDAMLGLFSAVTDRNPVFSEGPGFVSPRQLYREMQRSLPRYQAIYSVPHEPRMEGIYYSCQWPDVPRIQNVYDAPHLRWLLQQFEPETEYDRDLILTMFMTAIWGGPGGSRPIFAVVSDCPGSGKTTLPTLVSRLTNGFITLEANEDFDKFKARLLSPEGRSSRMVLLDNKKGYGFSSPELEAVVTSAKISGRANNIGESTRPNDILWTITGNGLCLCRDLAERSVIIRLRKPAFKSDWLQTVSDYVAAHRSELIGELIGCLRADPAELSSCSRWGTWEQAVLSRMPEPAELQELIRERQGVVDVEGDAADEVASAVAHKLQEVGLLDPSQMIWLPWRVCAPWIAEALGYKKPDAAKLGRQIKQMIDRGLITDLKQDRKNRDRGLVWVGDAVTGVNVRSTRPEDSVAGRALSYEEHAAAVADHDRKGRLWG